MELQKRIEIQYPNKPMDTSTSLKPYYNIAAKKQLKPSG